MDDTPMVSVTALTHLQGTTVILGFDDNTTKFVDLAPFMVGPIFDELRAEGLEADVSVDPELGTVVWPNGADLPPDRLRYENSFPTVGHRSRDIGEMTAKIRAALADAGLVIGQRKNVHLANAWSLMEHTLAAQKSAEAVDPVSVQKRVVRYASGSMRTVTVYVSPSNGKFEHRGVDNFHMPSK